MEKVENFKEKYGFDATELYRVQIESKIQENTKKLETADSKYEFEMLEGFISMQNKILIDVISELEKKRVEVA